MDKETLRQLEKTLEKMRPFHEKFSHFHKIMERSFPSQVLQAQMKANIDNISKSSHIYPNVEESLKRILPNQDLLTRVDSILQKLQPEQKFQSLIENAINKSFPNERWLLSFQKEIDRLTNNQKVMANIAQANLALAVESSYYDAVDEFNNLTENKNLDFISALLKVIQSIIDKTSSLNIEFYLNIIITLALFVITTHDMDVIINNTLNRIDEIEIKIDSVLELMNNTDDKYIYYVVERSVNVRNKPTTKKSKILQIIYPNQKVKLLMAKHKWIKIEYFDWITKQNKQGWVYKKYLRLIK